MDEDAFRAEVLKRADEFVRLYQLSRQKPRLSKLATVVAALVGLIAAGFGVQQGYTAYKRYSLEKKFADYYKSVGDEFLRKGEYQRALDAFKEADKLRPYDALIYYGRVKAFAFLKALRKDQLDLAEVQCKLVIDHDPRNAEAHKFLGIIYGNRGSYSDAEEAFSEAIKLNGGEYDDAEYDLAKLYAEHAKTFSKLSKFGFNERVAYLKKAIARNQELLKRRPKESMAAYNIACDYALLDEVDDGIHALESALEKGYDRYYRIAQDPDLDGIRQEARFVQLMRNRYTDIVVEYQGLVESGSTASETFHSLAWAQLYSGNPAKIREGIEYANRALIAEPQNAAYMGTLAELYAAIGNHKLALERIKLAIDKQPSRSY